METKELKRLIRDVGNSVHVMNTIAIALSKLEIGNCEIPSGLDISWKPSDIENSKIRSRNYAERAAIIFSVESFYVYLSSISQNPFWIHPEINFKKEQNKSKADIVYEFLNQIPKIGDEIKIISELICLWRNKIVHPDSSNVKLNNGKIGKIRSKKDYIYENYHHFDINTALDNYDNRKITLKDSSTLITVLIKAARLVDEFFFDEFSFEKSLTVIKESIKESDVLSEIIKTQDLNKKRKKLNTFILMTYPFLNHNQVEDVITALLLK